MPILTKFYSGIYFRCSPDKSNSAEMPLMGWVWLLPGGTGLCAWSFVLGPLEVPLFGSAVKAVPPSMSNKSLREGNLPISHLRAYHDSGEMSQSQELSLRCINFYEHFFTGACRGVFSFFSFKKNSQGLSYALMLHENIFELLKLFTEQENHFLPGSNSAWSAVEALPVPPGTASPSGNSACETLFVFFFFLFFFLFFLIFSLVILLCELQAWCFLSF